MANNDKADLLIKIATYINDNTAGDISPSDLRTVLSAMVTADLNLEELTQQLANGVTYFKSAGLTPQLTDPAQQEGLVFYDAVNNLLAYYNNTKKVTIPEHLLAIGQVRNGPVPVTQVITTTPTPIAGFSNDVFNLNTNITSIPSGNAYRATFASSAGYDGIYEFNGTISIASSANVIVKFEFYKNGAATGVFSVVDLINNNINTGSTAVSAFDRNGTTVADEYEVYVYTNTGTTTMTVNSFGFNMKRLGSS